MHERVPLLLSKSIYVTTVQLVYTFALCVQKSLYISLFHTHMREQRIAEKMQADFVAYEVFVARAFDVYTIVNVEFRS